MDGVKYVCGVRLKDLSVDRKGDGCFAGPFDEFSRATRETPPEISSSHVAVIERLWPPGECQVVAVWTGSVWEAQDGFTELLMGDASVSDTDDGLYRGVDRIKEVSALGSGNSGFGEETQHYNPKLLESFRDKHPNKRRWVQLVCGEFTSLCPKTGQPDWAEITIAYIPNDLCVESKSLKLYLGSFRNHGDFHEDVVNVIADDLVNLLDPFYLEVFGRFHPRGGIAIYPYAMRCANSDQAQFWADRRMREFNPMTIKPPALR